MLALRDELRNLREKVSILEDDRLLEANDAIVVASERAETIAEAALASLVDLTVNSQRDPLIGTPNRVIFLDRVERAIALSRRGGTRFAILFLDIDDFKRINDTLGHGVGDNLLRFVANTLRNALRESDTVSRLGGDEFVVLLHAVDSRKSAASTALVLCRLLEKPNDVDGRRCQLGVSIGLAMYPDDGATPETLIAHADADMYRHKDKAESSAQEDGPEGTVVLQPFVKKGGACDAEGSPAAFPKVSLEAADLREANERLVIAAIASQEHENEAVQSYRRQARSMAIVAHELRVPLHPLRMAASILGRAATSEVMLDRLKLIIDRQVTYMARLVEDLVDGSRIDAGTLRMERSRVDLVELVENALETCRTLFEQREQHLSVELPKTPLYVNGDPLRLTQVAVNLLDNASKYSHRGGEVRLHVGEAKGQARLAVADDGVGIPPEALPTIFEFFVQEPRALAHAQTHAGGGLGIGLGVVRELVTAHGGQVTATSPGSGRGSEFVVTLPLCTEDPDIIPRPE